MENNKLENNKMQNKETNRNNKSFLKYLKINNKGADISIIGVTIIMLVFFSICLQIDMYLGSLSRIEVQSVVELAQVYAMIDTINITEARKGNPYINEVAVRPSFEKQIKKQIKVNSKSYFQKFEIKHFSVNSHNNDYHFISTKDRQYYTCTTEVEYVPKKFIKQNQDPIKVVSTVRIYIHREV